MSDTPAERLHAAGYRLHWVTIEKTIPVLTKDPDGITPHEAAEWAEDDASDWDVSHRPMRQPAGLGATPWCDDDLTDIVGPPGDPPTVRELLDVQKRGETA